MVTGVIPSPPRFLPSIFIAHRVQQSRCSSIVHRMLLTQALALSASQFVHKKKSQRIYTSMHSAGLELTKLTYTRLEDNLIRHRGDRYIYIILSRYNTIHNDKCNVGCYCCPRRHDENISHLVIIRFHRDKNDAIHQNSCDILLSFCTARDSNFHVI